MSRKFPMDLSKFKKIKVDKDATILRHPHGHEFKIAHKAIGPEMKSQLDELPHFDQGTTDGTVGDSKKSFAAQIAEGARGNRSALAGYEEQKRILAEKKQKSQTASQGTVSESQGGMIPHYAFGEAVESEGNPPPEPTMADKASQYLANTPGFGAPVASPEEAAPTPEAAAIPPQAPSPDSMSPAAPQDSQSPSMDPYGTTEAQKDLTHGIGLQNAGFKGQADAAAAMGKAQADTLLGAMKQQQEQQAHYQDNLKNISEEHDALMQDIQNSHIDPKHYLGTLDTGHKITTAIGLLLGGMGSGLTGGPNPAMQYLNSQIDRDIEAQKSNLGKKESLLSANMRHYGNLRDAVDATRAGMQGIVNMQIQHAAATSSGPNAKAIAQIHMGELEQQTAGTLGQMAARRTLMSGNGPKDPTQLVQMMVPETHRKEVAAEIDRAQDTARMGDTILKSFDEAAHNMHGVVGKAASLVKTPRALLAMHQALQPTFKDLEGTVRQAAMDNTFHNVSPSAGDTAKDTATKREALVDYLKSKASASLAKTYGIDLSKFPSTSTDQVARMSPQQQQWVGWARQNPQDPRAQAVLKKLGAK